MENKKCQYAICISKQSYKEWKEVVQVLQIKHKEKNPYVVVYNDSLIETLPELQKLKPYYTCFVTQPNQCTRKFVQEVHMITRLYDDNDTYSDTIWGILTGPDIETALNIATHSKKLQIHHVLSNCQIPIEKCEIGTTFSEFHQNVQWVKNKNSCIIEKVHCPNDCSQMFTQYINNVLPNVEQVDLVVSSAHAREHEMELTYKFPGGKVMIDQDSGELFCQDLNKNRHQILSTNPKVYLAGGNCLMGHINKDKCISLSWMKNAAVYQFVGYTEKTWFGYGGWGVLKYFIDGLGAFTFSESYFANLQTLIWKLSSGFFKDENEKKGLIFDSNCVAFYGDPAWEAKVFVPNDIREIHSEYTLKYIQEKDIIRIIVETIKDGQWSCEQADDRSVSPGRPPFYIFKEKVNGVLISGNVVLTSLFVLFCLEGEFKVGEQYECIIGLKQ